MPHNGPPPHTVAVVLRESSKGKSQFEVVNSDGKSPRHEGRKRQRKLKENSNALRRTASFVFVFECIRRRFIFVLRCWNLRPFAAQATKEDNPPTWMAPTRASLSTAGYLALWHPHTLGLSTVKLRWDGPQVLWCKVRGEWAHTHTHTLESRKTPRRLNARCSTLYIVTA